jgi:CubicO group peptidase (beta-lactamase class C family)
MKRLAQLFIVVILTYTSLFAQLERQEEPTYKLEGLDYLFKPTIIDTTQLDSILNQRISIYHIPGLTALITKKEGGIVWKRNYGLANIVQNRPVEDTTLFLLASVSKTILATAVMQFWEADSFDLDDPVNDYLDNFQVFNPHFPNDTITIKMLLVHTSGINDRFPFLHNFNSCGDSPMPLESFLINYLTPGGSYYDPNLNFSNIAPGAAYNYSNVGASLLALLVEKFSGMSFNQYCRENIFDPLEMDKSSFLLAELDTNEIATPYLWSGGQYVPFCHMGHPFYPVAFLRSNKMEMQHFLISYMNWGKYNGNRILDSSTVALILSDHLGYPVPGYGDYQGLIWYQSGEMNGRFPWGHTGTWWGANAGMFFKQEEDWGIICFWNAGLVHSIVMDILNILCSYAASIPVELTSFTAISNGDEVTLNWTTSTETNNAGFEILRFTQNDNEWKLIGYVSGFGTTTEPKSYSYTDLKVSAGKYTYRLKQIDFDGSYDYSPEVEVEVSAPLTFSLEQNYPNPFNPITTIKYSIPTQSKVVIKIFDILGNEIATLVNDEKPSGSYELEFSVDQDSSHDISSGIYFYQLRSGSFIETKKMILMK